MTAEIKTVIGQLNITGGTWQREAPNQVAVREPKSEAVPGAGKGDLFILTKVFGQLDHPAKLEQQLAQTIRDAYYLARGSITASLRRALQAGSDQLYHHNHQVSKKEQVIAGVVALVMNDQEAFVAQLGPAAFFAILSDHVRRYPTKSFWLTNTIQPETPLENEPALGLQAVIEPNIHHLRVNPGDILILSDSQLAGQLPLDHVVRAAVSRNAKATVKNLGQMIKTSNSSALALAILEAEASTFASFKNPTAQLSRLFEGHRQKPVAVQTAAASATQPESQVATASTAALATAPLIPNDSGASPLPAEKVKSRSILQKSKLWAGGLFSKSRSQPDEYGNERHSQAPPPDQPPRSRQPASQPPQPEMVYDEVEEPLTGRTRVMASMAHDPSFETEWSSQRRPATRTFSIGRFLRWLGAGVLIVIALLGSGLKTILSLVLPGSSSQAPRQAGVQAHQRETHIPWKLLRNIAIAIPLLVAIIVSISYIQKGRLREAEYQEFLTTAQNKYQQAQAVTTDPTASLGLMAEAEASLVEAEKLKEGQPEIAELRSQMAETTDAVGNVQRLYYLPQLRQYTDPGTDLRRIIVQGVELYVMDVGTDRIFHHRLDDLGETLLPDDEASLLIVSRGQQVENVTASDLLDMTWMPAGGNRQTSDLVILNSTGLLEYNSNWGITTSALAGGEQLVLPTSVSSYFGNFYVLDPQGNQLLRYLPTADGYSASPESYFPADQPVDLTNSIDFDIDGAIYVLFQDGNIRKFESGQPAEFNLTGLDKPLKNPVSIFTAPDEEVQYIYVADSGNQRIVQLEKDGRFVRQFKPRPGETVSFANLQDIYVDEIGGRLYLLDSNNLYVGNIPGETIEPEAAEE